MPAVELTDLPMIKEGRAAKLRQAGIETIEDLWKADLVKLEAHEAFQGDEGFVRKQLPILQGFAEANVRKDAVVYAADERLFDLAEPIIHMDLEFDGPASQIFLYGLLDHHTDEVQSWFETSRKGQERLLRDYRDLCREGATMVTWGGATSDTIQLKRASEKYGISPKWVDQVNWLDLQTDVVYTGSPETQRVYLPVRKFKSERVAQFFGYEKPKLNVKDGYHALKLYRSYRRRPSEKIKQDLIEYNAEDIRHTKLILEGLWALMEPLR